jgi:hypothetical protein
MTERIITLNLHYVQNVRLKRHRNFGRIILGDEVPILVREVAPTDAPIAYNFTSKEITFDQRELKRRSVERQHKVRLFDQRLWWPLITSSGKMTLSHFVKLAASGELNAFMASEDIPWPFYPSPRGELFDEAWCRKSEHPIIPKDSRKFG